jgi:hypothetical protein
LHEPERNAEKNPDDRDDGEELDQRKCGRALGRSAGGLHGCFQKERADGGSQTESDVAFYFKKNGRHLEDVGRRRTQVF